MDVNFKDKYFDGYKPNYDDFMNDDFEVGILHYFSTSGENRAYLIKLEATRDSLIHIFCKGRDTIKLDTLYEDKALYAKMLEYDSVDARTRSYGVIHKSRQLSSIGYYL